MTSHLIGGVFSHVGDAERAIQGLTNHGYKANDISVFAQDKHKVNVLEDETKTSVTSNKGGRGENAGKGAGIGAASGGVLGGLSGLVVGLGLLAIPGVGQIAAAGPLASALTGAGVGAGGGGIVGALVGMGMPKEQAKQYEGHLKDGKIIVLVEAAENHAEKVYRTFMSNRTENSSMYPEHVRNEHDHHNHHSHNGHHEDHEHHNDHNHDRHHEDHEHHGSHHDHQFEEPFNPEIHDNQTEHSHNTDETRSDRHKK
ncbi:general stress protein [Salimicrobium halophilum]|uniref:Heat induced stress protein YflT n=1 Tax=Salimicrobium halophilum TaxID=86666 RepID=A0A1G8T309_9BACI|nr:general stress protein [Salimicrobium halophilum]SDJ35856.1 Heat induced stress protein YflT [Salimicrobium halophilum]